MAITSAQSAYLAEIDRLLAEADTTREELDFPFLAWFDRCPIDWIVEKALTLPREEAA
jgi:hypothetical protein